MTGSDQLQANPPSVRARLARVRAFLWRFRTLALADRVFAGVGAAVYQRPFCGGTLLVEVARSSTQQLLFLEGERFIPERALVRRILRPGMRVVDVGANIGYYLLLVESIVGSRGEILCLEPEADNVRELHRNIARNELTNVVVMPAAAGAMSGEVALRPGLNATVVAPEPGARAVAMVRLDDAVTAPVDFLKIDVEGHEGYVLAGSMRLLREQRPRLFIELHPGFLAAPYTVDEILRSLMELYPSVQLFESAPEQSLGEKIQARYLGAGIRPVPGPGALLEACRRGVRQNTFWAVCARDPIEDRAVRSAGFQGGRVEDGDLGRPAGARPADGLG